MGKILLFEEISDRVLKDIANEEDKIKMGFKDVKEPLLFGIRNYSLPERTLVKRKKEEIMMPYDVIFHYIKREKPWNEIRYVKESNLIIPVIPTFSIRPDEKYLEQYLDDIKPRNIFVRFAVRYKGIAYTTEKGKEISVCPSLIFGWYMKSAKKEEKIQISTGKYPSIKEDDFYEFFQNPEKARKSIEALRKEINKVNTSRKQYN